MPHLKAKTSKWAYTHPLRSPPQLHRTQHENFPHNSQSREEKATASPLSLLRVLLTVFRWCFMLQSILLLFYHLLSVARRLAWSWAAMMQCPCPAAKDSRRRLLMDSRGQNVDRRDSWMHFRRRKSHKAWHTAWCWCNGMIALIRMENSDAG